MKTNKFILLAIIVLAAMTIFFSCKGKSNRNTNNPIPKIDVTKPLVMPIVLHREYPGYLKSNNIVDVVGRVNGYVIKQNFSSGQYINEGDLLYIIDPTIYENRVNQAEADLSSAEATLDYYENNYQRMLEASKSDAISQIDLIQAETNVRTAKANVKNAESALKTARITLSYCYIKAPISGYLTTSGAGEGEYVSGSDGNPFKLTTIYNNDPMYAYFNIEDNQYLMMRMQSQNWGAYLPKKVYVNMQEGDFPPIEATPNYISPYVNLKTGTLTLRAFFENSEYDLKSGMYCTVSLPYGENDNAILIPDASTGTDQLGRYIYVVDNNNIVSYRHIEVGEIIDDSLIHVKSGLSPDELFVTKALLKVRAGMKVEPINK
ncbi:MAG: efflux RND transporter periplasmic adaptor subunit [Bacteroidales bacterium]|nr:efflux RND transporter periplasmic adaptor subunit [Bacteroidales bacterium]